MKLEYRLADATQYRPDCTHYVIAHIVNNVGAWGAGFSGALSRAFPLAAIAQYWRNQPVKHSLGAVTYHSHALDVIKDEDGEDQWTKACFIAHMCAQDGIGTDRQRVDYAALETCFETLANTLTRWPNIVVVMPRIGTGLGGGKWADIEPIIQRTLANWSGTVCVCDLKPVPDTVYV